MVVLVASHPRSGTHFLIDSILQNFNGAELRPIRPGFSSLENLLLIHDKGCTDEFYDFVFGKGQENELRICKTHVLASELKDSLEKKGFLTEKDREIVSYLFFKAPKVYIKRDVRDTLVSLYHFERNGGGLFGNLKKRLAQASISEFLRMPNHLIFPCREFQEFDRNVVTYWAEHMRQWDEQETVEIQYEDLKENFEKSIRQLAQELKVGHLLKEEIRQPQISKLPSNIFSRLPRRIQNRFVNKTLTAVFPRKGIVGDHKTHFTQEDYLFINKQAMEIQDVLGKEVRAS